MAIRPQCNVIVMSHYQEKKYGMPIPLGSIDKRFNPREPIILNPTQDKVDDSGRIKGHEFPTDPYGSDFVVMRNMEIPFAFDASLELLGLLLASAMGHVDKRDGPGTVAIATSGTATFTQPLPPDVVVGDSIEVTAGGNTTQYKIDSITTSRTSAEVSAAPGSAVSATAFKISFVTESSGSYRRRMRAGDICVYDQFPSTTWITGHAPGIGVGKNPETFIRCEGVIVNDLTIGVSSKSWIDLTGTAYSNGKIDNLKDADFTTATAADRFTIPAAESAKNYLIGPNIEVVIWSYPTSQLAPASGKINVLESAFPSRNESGQLVYGDSNTLVPSGLDSVGSAVEGTPADFTKIFRGFEFGIANSLDTEDAHGNIAAAGVYSDSLRVGDRSYTLNVTVEGNQGDPRWQAYRSNTVHRLDFRIPFGKPNLADLTSGKSATKFVHISFPIVTIDTVTPGFDGIRSTMELAVKPFAQPLTGNSPVMIIIENEDAEYNKVQA